MREQNASTALSWQNIIANFLSDKSEAEFTKYSKDLLKKIGKSYENERLLDNEDIAFIFDTRKNRKPDEQKEIDFIIEQIKTLSEFPEQPKDIYFEELYLEINDKNQDLQNKYDPQIWLDWAAENAKNVSFATHAPKLTHSIIDSPAILDLSKSAVKTTHLTTSSLKNIAIDGVLNNALSPIFQLLDLELNGKKLVNEFNDLATNVLQGFAENNEQMLIWNEGFSRSLGADKPKAHFLLKQVYFPIDDSNYHLLCNLVSSSIAQALFEFSRRNSNENFKLKNGSKFSPDMYFNFPNRASISITASNHGNASQLNGKRGGRLGLFSCQPPVWHSQLNPPIYKDNFFYELSNNYEVRENIQFLSGFLTRFEDLKLSIKDPKRMRWVIDWIDNLTDEVIVYVKSIQALPAGWSLIEGIKLKVEHQVLLDCYRTDDDFAAMKANSSWRNIVIQDFSSWLNNRLHKINKNFTPTDIHTKLWNKLFEESFRDILDINVAAHVEESL